MKCPVCGYDDSRVLDSRPVENKIKRRRECMECGNRFTTFETTEKPLLMVEKKGGGFEPFDRGKLIRGVYNAIKKRPINAAQVEKISDNIENFCANRFITQITTAEIGEMILEQLKNIDHVAYIRFASVYKDFTDVESFINAIGELNSNRPAQTSGEK